ncbi:MAG: Rieske 2Fe-2S domain-containing protein [Pseudomonadales bacterium]|nr:Rieske 2Fe-2S domain-containing protein [Pseudomonadales bacterium]
MTDSAATDSSMTDPSGGSMSDTVIVQSSWVDTGQGTVDRRIFSDQAIYQQELKRVFARGWNFICHESQIPESGCFFLSYIGEDQVIAVRDREGGLQVLLNSCPHRGNTVCRSEQGKARSFFCSYHGWNFDLDGKLVGVPGYKDFYRQQLDKQALGLQSAAKVESYKGFVFASLDKDAPDLKSYLGWVGRLGLDLIAERGDMEVIDGIQKNRIKCNWKLAVDNLFDWYHPKVSHGSAERIGMLDEKDLRYMNQMVMLGEFGHAIAGGDLTDEHLAEIEKTVAAGGKPDNPTDRAQVWRTTEAAKQALGPVGVRCYGHPNIFPNLWVSAVGPPQVCLRIPRGPFETELWWFTFVDKNQTDKEKAAVARVAGHIFGPSGLLEQDDGENWSHSTRGSVGAVTGQRPINFSMGLGLDKMTADVSGQNHVKSVVNEHAQLWLYRAWQDWMAADDWAQLRDKHSLPPDGVV